VIFEVWPRVLDGLRVHPSGQSIVLGASSSLYLDLDMCFFEGWSHGIDGLRALLCLPYEVVEASPASNKSAKRGRVNIAHSNPPSSLLNIGADA
jgi:hypothetical protein